VPRDLTRSRVTVSRLARIAGAVCACLATPGWRLAQEPDRPRHLSAAETGCDSLHEAAADSAYEADAVDRPARAHYLRVNRLPYRMGEVRTGRTMLQFVVDGSGRVDRCSIVLVEESSPEWTAAVLTELRGARYEPARKGGQRVRQVVYQVFTYHNDGRTGASQ
jgi:outer membrane biosynthesis protein TonB